MALSILKGLNLKMPEGKPEEILETIKKDPLYDIVLKHRETRSSGWLSYIGYKREKVVAPGTGDITKVEQKASELQKQIDELRRPAMK